MAEEKKSTAKKSEAKEPSKPKKYEIVKGQKIKLAHIYITNDGANGTVKLTQEIAKKLIARGKDELLRLV